MGELESTGQLEAFGKLKSSHKRPVRRRIDKDSPSSYDLKSLSSILSEEQLKIEILRPVKTRVNGALRIEEDLLEKNMKILSQTKRSRANDKSQCVVRQSEITKQLAAIEAYKPMFSKFSKVEEDLKRFESELESHVSYLQIAIRPRRVV